MSSETSESRTNRITSRLRRIFSALSTMAEARLDLALTEIKEERARLATIVACAVGGVALIVLGIGTLTACLALTWPDSAHWITLGVGGLELLGAAVCLWTLYSKVAKDKAPLSETISEFRKDRELFDRTEQSDTREREDLG